MDKLKVGIGIGMTVGVAGFVVCAIDPAPAVATRRNRRRGSTRFAR